jgi:hypothetical protein
MYKVHVAASSLKASTLAAEENQKYRASGFMALVKTLGFLEMATVE